MRLCSLFPLFLGTISSGVVYTPRTYTGRGKIILDGPVPDVTNRTARPHVHADVNDASR